MTVVGLSTGLRRGELLGLRWQDVDLLERRVSVAQQFVRGEMTSPKSRAGRRTIPLGAVAADALEEQWRASRHRADDSVVFSHPALGTPLDPSKLGRYARNALTKAKIPESFRPWHGMRHTALTETAAAGVPGMFLQAKAGHAQGSTTERYLHAHPDRVPGRGRARRGTALRRGGRVIGYQSDTASAALLPQERRKALFCRAFPVAGAGFEPATSGL